jgi:hypothetical protein
MNIDEFIQSIEDAKNNKNKNCKHAIRGLSVIKNFTYADTGDHFYCPICQAHWWKDRKWSAKEWDEYINGATG